MIGTTRTFVYPNFGTPDGNPDYTAHSGQTVLVVRQLTKEECDSECPMYVIRAADGWEGNADSDELSDSEWPMYGWEGNKKPMRNTLILDDKGDNPGASQLLHVEGDKDHLAIRPEGYGEASAAEGHGFPVLFEKYNGKLRLIVWGDINQQDPTHIICLDGAQESRLGKETFSNGMTREFGPTD
jgi:hypothetical protein